MASTRGKHVCTLPDVPACISAPPTDTGVCRYIKCKVHALRLPWQGHHGTRAFIRSTARLRAERARGGLLIHPYSVAALLEDALCVTLTLALFLYAPFQVFVTCPNPLDPFILFTDVMAFLHIIFSFGIGYVEDENRQIVLEPRAIARHYCRTYFWPDLIGALPLQIIEIFEDCTYPTNTTMLILKLFRVPTFVRQVGNLMDQMELPYVKRTVISVILKLVLFFHWMTFIHYQVPCFSIHFYDLNKREKVWLRRYFVVQMENDSIFQKYISNLFLVCNMCVGSTSINTETEHLLSDLILTSATVIASLVFIIYTMTELLLLCIYMQYEKNLFNGRLRELKEYMTFKGLPQFLQRKIQLFINYKYNGHYLNEELIMSTINEQIKQEINMYACKKMVMAVPLFQDMPIALINTIIFNLTQVLYMPGEALVTAGEPATSMFIISSGTVAVVSPNGREIAHLRDGSYFGDTALLQPGQPRSATVFALEITEIYKLESAEFQTSLQPYPRLRRRLEAYYRRRDRPDSAQGTY